MTATIDGTQTAPPSGPKPIFAEDRPLAAQIGTYIFILVPFVALVAAIPLAWMFGFLGWTDIFLGAIFYVVSILGVTVGFHRYFTNG